AATAAALTALATVRVGRALGLDHAASALAGVAVGAVRVAKALGAAAVVTALLVARAVGGRHAVTGDALAHAGVALERRVATVRVGPALLTLAVDAVQAPFGATLIPVLAVVVVVAVRVVGPTGRKA